jgi:hypothetical protein
MEDTRRPFGLGILWPICIFVAIWYIVCTYGNLVSVLVCYTIKNLATLPSSYVQEQKCRVRNLQLGGIRTRDLPFWRRTLWHYATMHHFTGILLHAFVFPKPDWPVLVVITTCSTTSRFHLTRQ